MVDYPDTNRRDPTIVIRTNIKPGDMGKIIHLHGVLYAQEHGFDHTFEPYVAEPLSAFVKRQMERERIWVVEKDTKVVGSIAIVRATDQQAQLRWLILSPEARGLGIGRVLVERSLSFCKSCGYESVFLWTVDELRAAKRLYESMGFVRGEEKTHRIWGKSITEVRYDIRFE